MVNKNSDNSEKKSKKSGRWKGPVAIVLLIGLLFLGIFYDVYTLGNDNTLFLFVDEEKGNPGTIEVSSVIILSNLRPTGSSIDIDPLSTDPSLNSIGVNINNCLLKASDIKQGSKYAKQIAQGESKLNLERVVIMDSETLKELVDVVGYVSVDFNQQITILGQERNINAKGNINGAMAKEILQGKNFHIVDQSSIQDFPETSLWRIKSKIIGEISLNMLDLAKYDKETRRDISYKILKLYKEGKIKVYDRNMTLTLIDILPESFGKLIIDFAVEIIN
ncbi:MAG TPA: hypothetical protein PKK55_02030 [Methanofastidiosum sp.]|nr:hypothetical protein [Methanofastidiosum sp.]HOG73760.1 hypothetical protein [Methanofastidiosum sp.]